MNFAQNQTLTGVELRANLAVADYIRAEVWDPGNMTKLASGTNTNGNNAVAFYQSTFTPLAITANKNYLVGVFFSNSGVTVFPRKDGPNYPFTVAGAFGNINVTACWSTSTTNTDIFPTSVNSWAPDLKLDIQ